ncbi:hypothetical protein AB0A71_19965 [Kitasatospora aureofaciens]|uniref:hypothetical protein n=1 Tax=Kitasatospora aureofaciens TaxID=1894 RepID=UPI0033EF37CD
MSRNMLRPALGMAAAVVTLVLTAVPVSAAPTTDPLPGDDAPVSLAVFGDASLTDGRELTVADLANDHGVDLALVQAYGSGETPSEPEPPVEDPAPQPAPEDAAESPSGAPAAARAPSPNYQMVASWTSSDHRTVNLRRGDGRTWGYTKIDQLHNLSVGAVRATTRWPAPGWPKLQTAPDSWIYVTKVNHIQCSGWWLWRTCKVVGSVDVQAVVNYGNPKGVITAYCQGIVGRCPDWVRNAANAA